MAVRTRGARRPAATTRAAPLPGLYEQLRSLPENLIGEIVHGQLYAQPRPAPRHAVAASSLGGELVGPFQRGRGGPGGWWIIDEPEIHFAPEREVLVPDLAGWRRERMPAIPNTAYFETPPDWVCEVLSEATASKDREVKMPVYARFGVAYAWLVDPGRRTLEAFRLVDGRWLGIASVSNDQGVSLPPFEAVTLKLSNLWC